MIAYQRASIHSQSGGPIPWPGISHAAWPGVLAGIFITANPAAAAPPPPAGARAAAMCPPNASLAPALQEQWWIDLTLAPLSRVPAAKRKEHLIQLKQQQAQVSAAVSALGATVLANVTHVRNALAVQMRAEQLLDVRRLPGVRSISKVAEKNRVGAACD